MISRQEIKTNARKALKKHYWMIVGICLISAFIGLEFTSSMDFMDLMAPDSENTQERSLDRGIVFAGNMLNSELSARAAAGGSFSQVLEDLLSGDDEKGAQDAAAEKAKREEKAEKLSDSFPDLGGTSGVLSKIVSNFASGTVLVSIYGAILSFTGSKNITIAILMILSYGIYWYVKYFLRAVYHVTTRRMFLESRVYNKVGMHRFLFLIRTRKMCRVFWVMLVKTVYETLWLVTVVGYVIKLYSYYLIPYIMAENPSLKANEAITLSRNMMQGHKWELFKLNLSFLGWDVLRILTMGLLGIFFVAPYKSMTYAEYYARVREESKAKSIEGIEKLNDRYLFEKADAETLHEAYREFDEIINRPLPEIEVSNGFMGILKNWFGILLVNVPGEKEYEEAKAQRIHAQKLKDAVYGIKYPMRLFTLPEYEKRKGFDNIYYIRNYSIPSLVLMFFTFSLIGWLWEVSLHIVQTGMFVNRGVLYGPWLPIYGSGGIMILLLLKKLRTNPVKEFFSAVLLCGIIEYMTSWYLEITNDGMKWWDYSGYLLNLNGRVCAEGLIVFGIGAMFTVYFAAPMLDNIYRKIKMKYLVVITVVLIMAFVADNIYSHFHPNEGEGITCHMTDREYAAYHSMAEQRHLPYHNTCIPGYDLQI